jgi:hypothetical protein
MRSLRRLLTPALLTVLVISFQLPGAEAAPPGVRYDDMPDAYGNARNFDAVQAWSDPDITFYFQNETPDISGTATERQAFRDAMDLWANASPLTFTEVFSAGAADITILFTASTDHGASYDDHNDNAGPPPWGLANGVLAHAFFPPPNVAFAGDAHFDEGETWTELTRANSAQPMDLVTIAAHEFGHSLGLGHSSNNSALMAPFYTGSHRFLHSDDVAGIQFLYPGGGGGGPTISIADATKIEGDTGTTNMRFKVTLSQSSASNVSVQFATANGSAIAPGDYTAKSGTVTIQAGKTSKLITIKIVGDTALEGNETFTVTLSNPTGGTINDGVATGTITDND